MSPDPQLEAAAPLWATRRHNVDWACELTFHGKRVGWEVILRRDGQRVGARIFDLHEVALAYAASERDDVERGYHD